MLVEAEDAAHKRIQKCMNCIIVGVPVKFLTVLQAE